MALAVEPDIIDGGARANAGHDVLQLPAARLVEQHVVGDDRSDPVASRHRGDAVQTQLVVRPAAQA